MKLFDMLFGKKNAKTKKTTPSSPVRHPPVKKAPSAALDAFPNKQPAPARPERQSLVRGPLCADNAHNFIRPYPLTCNKCGLPLQWDSQHIERYMGSYFDGISYQWTHEMRRENIYSFSVSCGNRPVFSASCDFSKLTVRNCLHGSRDGWMQSRYPKDYFEPKDTSLEGEDVGKLRRYLESCNFFAWKTPTHYVENHDAPGFSVEKSFRCTFVDGKQFVCLDPNHAEFDQLIALLRELAEKRASQKDKPFIERMLEDTGRKEKHIYWLISQSLEEKWMKLVAEGVPFFNYMVSKELRLGENANAELMVNVIRFSDGAAWVTEKGVPEKEYQWEPLPKGSKNDLGAAFNLLTRHFEKLPEPGRKLFPIVVVVLDGLITDDWLAAQARFQGLPGVGQNVLTIGLALGDNAEKRFLKNFDGVIYNINSMEDIINEMDSPLFGM